MNLDFLKIEEETNLESKFKSIAEKLFNNFAVQKQKGKKTQIIGFGH